MIRATPGRLLIDASLPEDMRGRATSLGKTEIYDLLRELALRHPDKYRDVSHKLANIGRDAATDMGGYSFGIEHLQTGKEAQRILDGLRASVAQVLADKTLSPKRRQEEIIKVVGKQQEPLINTIYRESLESNNPLGMQVKTGSRGNKMNLGSLLGADLLYQDHHDEIIPIPVLNSYSKGLDPAEYWAGTYGARKGIIGTKFATAQAGFFGKQLNQLAHRSVIAGLDDPDNENPKTLRGMPVDVDDRDNEGSLLAHDIGGYKRNTPLTPRILRHLKSQGIDKIVIRSPLVGGTPDGGLYARDVGVLEDGYLPGKGRAVGMTAAQALSEPVSQGMLNTKHGGGVAGQDKAYGGFHYLDQLIQKPQTFQHGATHSTQDGRVTAIEDAPAGGKFVFVNNVKHYVPTNVELKVKVGDDVEAGDVVSHGIPNPSVITQYKGIGEGRRYFTKAFRDTMKASNLTSHRRNIELVGRSLINHVKLTDEFNDDVMDTILPYDYVASNYKPRDGYKTLAPDRAIGKYLESPVLHHTIGTKVRPSMLDDMKRFGIETLDVHDDPPPFEPYMVRAMNNLHYDMDPVTRMYGSGLKSSLLDSVHRGLTSNENSTSFVPGLAKSINFGRTGLIRQPQPGIKPDFAPEPPEITPPKPEIQAPKPQIPEQKPPAQLKAAAFKAIAQCGNAKMAKPVAPVATVHSFKPLTTIKSAERSSFLPGAEKSTAPKVDVQPPPPPSQGSAPDRPPSANQTGPVQAPKPEVHTPPASQPALQPHPVQPGQSLPHAPNLIKPQPPTQMNTTSDLVKGVTEHGSSLLNDFQTLTRGSGGQDEDTPFADTGWRSMANDLYKGKMLAYSTQPEPAPPEQKTPQDAQYGSSLPSQINPVNQAFGQSASWLWDKGKQLFTGVKPQNFTQGLIQGVKRAPLFSMGVDLANEFGFVPQWMGGRGIGAGIVGKQESQQRLTNMTDAGNQAIRDISQGNIGGALYNGASYASGAMNIPARAHDIGRAGVETYQMNTTGVDTGIALDAQRFARLRAKVEAFQNDLSPTGNQHPQWDEAMKGMLAIQQQYAGKPGSWKQLQDHAGRYIEQVRPEVAKFRQNVLNPSQEE